MARSFVVILLYMSTLTLDMAYDYDFFLMGISSHLKDYRLCWHLNKHFDWDLARQDDQTFEVRNTELSFSHYAFMDEDQDIVYTLLSNRGSQGFLIPEKKAWDFFLVIDGNISRSVLQTIEEDLNKIEGVNAVQRIDANALASKQNLIVT
jgi:hypothetical protein